MMVGRATQRKIGVGWTVWEKDSVAGEEQSKMKVKAVESGKHKKDGKSQEVN